jgi:hypothetical protein
MITKFDKNLIEQYIEEGWLIRQWHPTLPLQILNYSRQTEYARFWNEITSSCRGIVLDKDYYVISPCMPKFFNFYQHDTTMQKEIEKRMLKEKFMVQDKWDGCIGNIFKYNGEIICASKGSFDSFVTKEMYKMIEGKLFINDFEDCSSTLIVEVIHPNTHILCNYGDTKEFRVITSFRWDSENNDYFEWPYEDTLNIIHIMDPKQELLKPIESHNLSFEQLREWQKQHNDKLTEGFVVRFLNDNFRCKFKSEEYLSIAAVKSNADQIHIYNNALALFNNKKDWPLYENGKWLNYINEQINQIPEDELREKGLKISQELYNKTQEIYNHYKDIAYKYKDLDDRELGLLSKTNKEVKTNLGIIFNIRNNKPMDKWLIEQVKEKYKENNSNE